MSQKTYDAIIVEAERFDHILSMHFGLLCDQCENEAEFIKLSKAIISQLKQCDDAELSVSFFGDHPSRQDLHNALDKISGNIALLTKKAESMKSDLDNTNAIIRKFEPMLKGLSFHELTILNRMVVNKIRLVQKAATLVSMSHFNVGDRVSWDGGDGMAKTGIVIRLNEKTVSVKTTDGRWNVSPQLLRREN